MYDWMYDDITWCGETECKNTSCRRHLNNRRQKEGVFTLSMLKGTELCPLKKSNKEKNDYGETSYIP